MHNDTQNFSALLQQTRLSIAECIFNALEKGEISEDESSKMAQYTLDETPAVTTPEELLSFLGRLVKKWSLFTELEQMTRMRLSEKAQTDHNLSGVQSELAKVINQP
jgi:hypothetical protein